MTDSKPQTPTTQTPPPSQTGFRERKLEGGKKQPESQTESQPGKTADMPKEVGGPPGPEPTRYGDWAFKGRVTDF
jgi:hypothetical protein